MRSRTWILVAIGVLATAGSAGAAKVATGGGSSTITVQGQEVKSGTAKCAPGKRLLSAGFETVDFDPQNNGPAAVRLTIKRSGKNAVYGTVHNFAQNPGDMALYAYCGEGSIPVKAQTASTTVDPLTVGTATATCKPGSEAISGGFESVGFDPATGPRLIALTSMRVGTRSWKVQAGNFPGQGLDAPGTLIAYVYCQSPGPGLIVRSAGTDTTVNGPPKLVDISCPPGSKPLSGGFDGHPSLDSTNGLSAAGSIISRRIDGGTVWRTGATNAGDPNPGSLTAYAYCRKRDPAAAAGRRGRSRR